MSWSAPQGQPVVGSPVFGVPEGGPTPPPPLAQVAQACGDPPVGLAEALLQSRRNTAARFWIVDNSGSMASNDGSMLHPHRSGRGYNKVPCTRWEELRQTVLAQAKLADAMCARLDLHLLNPPHGPGARQYLSMGTENSTCPSRSGNSTFADLHATMMSQPNSSTPLTEAVVTIHNLLQPIAPSLKASGQTVAIILATDGHPNDPRSFVQALQALQRLGCIWVVVRLCTEQEDVLSYWNDLDKQLESPLEVLDDAESEAAEIYRENPWVTYGLPLHMLREAGVEIKLLDLIDEKPFIGSQVAEMCSLLFGCAFPNPEADWEGFEDVLGVLMSTLPPTYCPVSKQMKPWIDLPMLRSRYKKASRKSHKAALKPTAWFTVPYDTMAPNVVTLQLVGQKLKALNWLSQSDPFFVMSCWCGGSSYYPIYFSEAVDCEKNPAWKAVCLPKEELYKWDPQGRLKFDVFDWEKSQSHQLIGTFYVTASQLLAGKASDFELIYEPLPKSKRGSVSVTAQHTCE